MKFPGIILSIIIATTSIVTAQNTATQNLIKGRDFLEDNGKRSGVKTTKSGLQYEIVKKGTGTSPKASDRVLCHYEGKLIEGKVFDSSYRNGKPITFGVMQVIPGWTEALQMMREGSKWKIYIPAKLAYGYRGSPPAIGPNETLIFDIELIKVNP
ncbi:MAG: FKBP-type peptidyl-prolyl cis-trans isomerase [Verrucomicrobiota bacterium]